MAVSEKPGPLVGCIGPDIFTLNGPVTRLEREALMRYRTWTRWQRYWWRIRYWWAKLRGRND